MVMDGCVYIILYISVLRNDEGRGQNGRRIDVRTLDVQVAGVQPGADPGRFLRAQEGLALRQLCWFSTPRIRGETGRLKLVVGVCERAATGGRTIGVMGEHEVDPAGVDVLRGCCVCECA